MAFQIDSICSQKTDEAIIAALEDLPKDLPDTFNRILRKLEQSNAADPGLCSRIFSLVAAAQRPLTLEELREAVSVEPGETSWDTSKLVNDMLRSLSVSCGSLLVIDEEHLTVHFAHHSVKQHLLTEPTDSEMKKYHIKMQEADLYLGDVIVTYLNFGIFDRQLVKATSAIPLSQVKSYPSAMIGRSLPRSDIVNRLAVRLLKNRPSSTLDVHSQLRKAAGILDGSKEETAQPAHLFLSYAQEYWLFHTISFKPAIVAGYPLWKRLIDGKVDIVQLPWALESKLDFGDEYMNWITQIEHFALINHSLVELRKQLTLDLDQPNFRRATRLLLEFLEKKTTNRNARDIDFCAALYPALFMNNQAVVLLSLKNGADVNADMGACCAALVIASKEGYEGIARILLQNGANVNAVDGKYGTALHVASSYDDEAIVRLLLDYGAYVNARENGNTALLVASERGFETIARLLLENGADVNAGIGYYGTTALHSAIANGHDTIVKLLLDNGANINATSREGDSVLHAASVFGHETIVRLLLENGADVDAANGANGTALYAASRFGFETIVRLLLERGADVNAENSKGDTALCIASANAHETIVRLLLNNGAIADNRAVEAASRFGNERTEKMLRNALKAQSSTLSTGQTSSRRPA